MIAFLIILFLALLMFAVLYFSGAKLHSMDRYMAMRPVIMIVMLFAMIVLVYLLLYLIGKGIYGVEDGNVLLSIFTQNQTPVKNMPFSFYLFVSLLGSLFFSGILVSLLTNAIIGRNNQYREGKLRYRLHNHYIVFGANSLLKATIDSIRRGMVAEANNNQKIVIVSGKEAETVRHSLTNLSELQRCIIIYHKELADPYVMKDLNLEYSRKIFIIGDEEPYYSDITNTHLLHKFLEATGNSSRTLRCDISIYDEKYLFAFQQQMKTQCIVRPFNYLEMCLANVWGFGCLSRSFNSNMAYYIYEDNRFALVPADGKPLHIYIVGFNEIARTVLRMIMAIAHYGKQQTTAVTIVSDDNIPVTLFLTESNIANIEDIRIETISRDKMLTLQNNPEEHAYFVVATADSEADRTWRDYLEQKAPEARILCYAENGVQEYKEMLAMYCNHTAYWGFRDISTFINICEEVYAHGQKLYDTQPGANKPFYLLAPLERQAWTDFINYLYNLLAGGLHIEVAPDGTDCREHNRQLIDATPYIGKAVAQYCNAQEVLHYRENSADNIIREQVEVIRNSYKDILIGYLANGGKNGLILKKNEKP